MTKDDVGTLVNRIKESRGRDIYAEEVRIGTMLDVVEYNKYELEGAYQKLQSSVNPDHRRPVSSDRQSEFLQSLHNYVASLYALYKHGNRYKQKFFCIHLSGTESCDECDSDNVSLLRKSDVIPDWNFVKKLRVYINHYRMPLLQSPITYDRDEIGQRNIFTLNRDSKLVLNSERFLDWAEDTDNKGANDFVKSKEEIRPVNICSRLYDAEREYYQNFLIEVQNRNEESLDEYDRLVEELREQI